MNGGLGVNRGSSPWQEELVVAMHDFAGKALMEGLEVHRSPGQEQTWCLAVDTWSPSYWGREKACTEHAMNMGEMRAKLQISKEPREANKEAPNSYASNQGPISTKELLISG